MNDIAVVGAGIAGMTAAHELRKRGHRPLVIEASDRVGGRMQSVHRDGFIFDVGQYMYLGAYRGLTALAAEVGLSVEKSPLDLTLTRNGEQHVLDPRKPLALARTRYLTTGEKLQAAKLAARLAPRMRGMSFDDATGMAAIDDESVASYVRRHAGPGLLDAIARPVCEGLGANAPDVAPLGQLLWTVRMQRAHLYGMPGGNDALPLALARGADVRLGCEVLEVVERDGGVEITSSSGTERFAACVLAVQPHVTLKVYPGLDAGRRPFLESSEYLQNLGIHLALSHAPKVDTLVAMGSMADNPNLAGCIADHRKASDRAPLGRAQITAFGNAAWAAEHLDDSDEAVLAAFLGMLKPVYGDLEPLLLDYEVDRWEHAGPRVTQGRFKALAAYERAVPVDGLVQLAGDFHSTGLAEAASHSGRMAASRVAGR